eukprot:TRINITY_DN2932_c0_g1_i2.p2 TRINITY_DN2932_c0_g1~~TRINITY_DN2932_c0_g1_i2.p2  ORF type:complete len:166 (+),score=45.88 TRINITY_DN2932_c0_g1_i2:140-637(+)
MCIRDRHEPEPPALDARTLKCLEKALRLGASQEQIAELPHSSPGAVKAMMHAKTKIWGPALNPPGRGGSWGSWWDMVEEEEVREMIIHSEKELETLARNMFIASAQMLEACKHGDHELVANMLKDLSLIHISEPTRLLSISYAVFCLKKKKKNNKTDITNNKIEK